MNDYFDEILKNKDLLNNLVNNCMRDRETGKIQDYRTEALGSIIKYLAIRAIDIHEVCEVEVDSINDDDQFIKVRFYKEVKDDKEK